MKKSILLLLVLFSAGHAYSFGKDGETKTARHTVSVSSGDAIAILAKNTYLQIESWDKNEVEVFAQVTFDGKENDKIRAFLDDFEKHVIDQITKSGGLLTIQTNLDEPNKIEIGKKKGTYFAGVMIGYSDTELRIEYTIKVPESNLLTVKSAYKDLVMTGAYDQVDITQYSAGFNAHILRDAKLNLKYGKTSVKVMGNGTLETYENDTRIGEAETLNINDKYSEYAISTLTKLNITGYESDVEIGTCDAITGNLKYGQMTIKEKVNNAVLTLYEYDIMGAGIVNLRLDNSKYSKIHLDRANEIRFVDSYEDELKIRYINTVIAKSKYGDYQVQQLGKKMELIGYEDDVIIGEMMNGTESLYFEGKYLKMSITMKGQPYSLNADVKYGKVSYNESNLVVNKYIKENDNLKIEASAKNTTSQAIPITIKGYEIKADIL